MDLNFALLILKVAVQIGAIAFCFYKIYGIFSQSKTILVIYALFIYILFFFLAEILRLSVLADAMSLAFIPFVLTLLLIYQQDLRHFIIQLSSSSKFVKKRESIISSENLTQILTACYSLADIKRGALIVIRRSDKLTNIVDKGTLLDCRISSALLLTIFDHDTPLHDGAVVVDYDKVVSAGCYLPLSEQTNIKSTFGTRHRAALGLSEESDAIVLVVSEESQIVSICFNSRIYPDLDIDDARIMLIQFMSYHNKTKEE